MQVSAAGKHVDKQTARLAYRGLGAGASYVTSTLQDQLHNMFNIATLDKGKVGVLLRVEPPVPVGQRESRSGVNRLDSYQEVLGSHLGWCCSWFSSVSPHKCRVSIEICTGSLPFKSFLIHYSHIVLTFDGIQPRYWMSRKREHKNPQVVKTKGDRGKW
jgi:hypothetical protein